MDFEDCLHTHSGHVVNHMTTTRFFLQCSTSAVLQWFYPVSEMRSIYLLVIIFCIFMVHQCFGCQRLFSKKHGYSTHIRQCRQYKQAFKQRLEKQPEVEIEPADHLNAEVIPAVQEDIQDEDIEMEMIPEVSSKQSHNK